MTAIGAKQTLRSLATNVCKGRFADIIVRRVKVRFQDQRIYRLTAENGLSGSS